MSVYLCVIKKQVNKKKKILHIIVHRNFVTIKTRDYREPNTWFFHGMEYYLTTKRNQVTKRHAEEFKSILLHIKG